MLAPVQCRAARAMLGLTQSQLAKQAGVSLALLRLFEAGDHAPKAETLTKIRAALVVLGVELFEGPAGKGVRLRPTLDEIEAEPALVAPPAPLAPAAPPREATATDELTPEQARAARALLNWTQDKTAAFLGVSPFTLKRFENGRRPHLSNQRKMRAAFESAGLRFIDEPDEIGVRTVRPPPAPKSEA